VITQYTYLQNKIEIPDEEEVDMINEIVKDGDIFGLNND